MRPERLPHGPGPPAPGRAAAAIGRSSFIPYQRGSRHFAVGFSSTFVSLNLSQFPETLIESELSGHRKGAFAGAVENHDGMLARRYRHDALFLDEVGEISVPIQIKRLRVLQDRTFTLLDERETQRFEGRVIAANSVLMNRRSDDYWAVERRWRAGEHARIVAERQAYLDARMGLPTRG